MIKRNNSNQHGRGGNRSGEKRRWRKDLVSSVLWDRRTKRVKGGRESEVCRGEKVRIGERLAEGMDRVLRIRKGREERKEGTEKGKKEGGKKGSI